MIVKAPTVEITGYYAIDAIRTLRGGTSDCEGPYSRNEQLQGNDRAPDVECSSRLLDTRTLP